MHRLRGVLLLFVGEYAVLHRPGALHIQAFYGLESSAPNNCGSIYSYQWMTDASDLRHVGHTKWLPNPKVLIYEPNPLIRVRASIKFLRDH